MGNGLENLSSKEFEFVTEILNGVTVEEAGRRVGIKRRSAYEWKAKTHIKAAIEAGKNGQVKVVQEFQAERVKVAIPKLSKMLEENAPKAVEVICDIMENGGRDDMVRLKAAIEIIKMSGVIDMQRVTQTIESIQEQKGLSAEAAADIRRKILGVEEQSFAPEKSGAYQINAETINLASEQ